MTIDVEAHKSIRKAIKLGDLQLAIKLIGDDKSRLEMMTPFGTWLHVAASFGHVEIVRWLIEKGISPNICGGTADATPLHSAALDGKLDVVKFLLTHGAKFDISEPERNPLFGAIYSGHTAVAKQLVESGIDTAVSYTGQNMKNMDALAFAKEWGRTEIVELLEERKRK